MRTSENYNLNLVEGTDIVNPLVQDVPNYEIIDEALFTNKKETIGVATELKSGSVHALTRLNTDAAMFRFTATSRFEAGETFTVDGIQVTALLPDGTTLESGAYIIGSTVLCSLVGTLLTIYGTRTKVDDADKLDGHTSDYYATKEGLDMVDATASSAGNMAAEALSKLNDYVNVRTIQTVTVPAIGANNSSSGISFTAAPIEGYKPILVFPSCGGGNVRCLPMHSCRAVNEAGVSTLFYSNPTASAGTQQTVYVGVLYVRANE